MKLGRLLEITRTELDDFGDPGLWSDAELIEYAVEAQNEAARRGRLFVDASTVAICAIALTASTHTYALDPRVIRVNRVRLTGDSSPLPPCMVRDLDRVMPGWEDDTGSRLVWVPDWETGKIRFVGNPATTGTANLQVVRLPLVAPDDADSDLEIREEQASNLRHWMIYRAYLKRDSETLNEKLAAAALALFEQEFGPRRPAYDEQWMLQYYADDPYNGRY